MATSVKLQHLTYSTESKRLGHMLPRQAHAAAVSHVVPFPLHTISVEVLTYLSCGAPLCDYPSFSAVSILILFTLSITSALSGGNWPILSMSPPSPTISASLSSMSTLSNAGAILAASTTISGKSPLLIALACAKKALSNPPGAGGDLWQIWP